MSGRYKRLAILFLAILAVKLVLLFADSEPGYFMGDSATYVDTAIYKHHIPPDRSFVFGYLIRAVGYKAHSLAVFIGFQVFLSAASAWMAGFYLLRFFQGEWKVVVGAALLCAVEPQQLLMERYVMTETVATFLFAAYIGTLLEYVRTRKLGILVIAQMVGMLLLSIRLSFLPDVLLNSVLVPLLCLKNQPKFSHAWRVVGVPLAVSVLVSQGLLFGYERLNARLMKAEPALMYADGYFLLADLLPVVRPVDFPIEDRRRALFADLKFDTRALNNRLAERWLEGEICDRIQKWWPEHYEGNKLAKATALHAIERDPTGVVRLAWREFVGYFDVSWFRATISEDEGEGQGLPAKFVGELQRWFNVPDPKAYQPSWLKTWHRAGMPWYWLVLCLSLLSPITLWLSRPSSRVFILILVAAGLLFFEGATLTVEQPNARYLTTAAWLVIVLMGIVLNWVLYGRSRSAAGVG